MLDYWMPLRCKTSYDSWKDILRHQASPRYCRILSQAALRLDGSSILTDATQITNLAADIVA